MPLLSLSLSQLLVAVVATSIHFKLASDRSFLKWLASHKFTCFLVPSNTELRKLKEGPVSHGGKRGNSKRQKTRTRKPLANYPDHDSSKDVFKIPTADLVSLNLDKTIIDVRDLWLINYSADLEWIVDLSLMSLFSFTIIETQFYFYPQTNESNYSLLWALLVIIYCIKTLFTLTSTYFKNDQSIGERSICIISGCFFLLIAMIVLITNENYLELGLETAYRSFNDSATAFVNNHTLSTSESRPTTRPISFIIVKFSTAVICSLIGVVFTFPGLRFGQLHRILLDKADTSSFLQTVYNLNYLAPLFIVCLWIKPISRDFILKQTLLPIDDDTFDTLRIYCTIIVNLFRFYLLPRYLTIFLASAKNRISRIRCRGGFTTNKEIQITIASIYNFVNVVAIQYILPILMCLFTSLLFKTMGGHGWLPSSISNSSQLAINATGSADIDMSSNDSFPLTDLSNSATESLNQSLSSNVTKASPFATMINLTEIKNIFSADVFRGVFGFATWWLHFSWFCTSTAGVIYHTYFIH